MANDARGDLVSLRVTAKDLINGQLRAYLPSHFF